MGAAGAHDMRSNCVYTTDPHGRSTPGILAMSGELVRCAVWFILGWLSGASIVILLVRHILDDDG